MRRDFLVVSLLALGALPGCVFAVDSGSSDGNRVSRLEKRVAKLESQMEECGEDCCNGDKDDDDHEAPKAHAEAHETPKPATGGHS